MAIICLAEVVEYKENYAAIAQCRQHGGTSAAKVEGDTNEIFLARQFHGALLDVAESAVAQRLRDGEPEPRRRVDASARPHDENDLFGALHCAHTLRLHRVTNGDVALDGERGEAERRGVDPCRVNRRAS